METKAPRDADRHVTQGTSLSSIEALLLFSRPATDESPDISVNGGDLVPSLPVFLRKGIFMLKMEPQMNLYECKNESISGFTVDNKTRIGRAEVNGVRTTRL
jgi:hypothetical protein